MVAKNYYRILEVNPSASQQDIRKSYRRLVFKYHPDRNPGDGVAEAHFKEIQEAYHMLSDVHRRAAYNQKRWFTRHFRKTPAESLTIHDLLRKSRELASYVAKLDSHSVDRKGLNAYMLFLLSNQAIPLLAAAPDDPLKQEIVEHMVSVGRHLSFPQARTIVARLRQVSPADERMTAFLDRFLQEKKMSGLWERLHPWLIVVVTLFLCWLLFVLAS